MWEVSLFVLVMFNKNYLPKRDVTVFVVVVVNLAISKYYHYKRKEQEVFENNKVLHMRQKLRMI